MRFLEKEHPDLWEKLKPHVLDMPDDWEGEHPIYCKKCGKQAIITTQLLWICPELSEVPDCYMSPG